MGKLLEYITEMFMGDRTAPRLNVSIVKVDASAESNADGPEEKTQVTWKMKLLVENEMDAAAADLKLNWPGDKAIFDIKLPYHVDRFGDRAVAFKIERFLPSGTVAADAAQDRLWEHLPEELADVAFTLSYRSPRGETYYTKYSQKGGTGSCEFPKSLPE